MSEQQAKENYATEVESFLDTLYGEQKGYVYVPTLDRKTEYWQEYYFKWPEHRMSIVTHILKQSRSEDVYTAPSLFKAPSAKQQAWKGTNYVWVEFDGNAPSETPEGIPMPSIRIQSSTSLHEHWYWKLDKFETDKAVLEGLAQQLTYTLDADKSGWDCNQVLRAPGTLHQESGHRVRLLATREGSHKISDFKNLVTPHKTAEVEVDNELPPVAEVVARYKWDEDAYDLFSKATQAVGSRSSALTRLGFHCVEMGMSNEECYVILLNADDRWGKFKHRSPKDRTKRLLGIITHCRGQKELQSELSLSERETFVSLGDFRSTKIKVKWVFRDFLAEQGLGIISAAPGIGKSTISFHLGFSCVLGKDFLTWKFAAKERKKTAFLSLEMSGMECQKMMGDMWPGFTKEEQDILDKDFYLLPLGYALPLHKKENQQNILDEIDRHGIEVLVIDSLKAATGLEEKKLDAFFNWLNEYVREKRKVTVWIVHHNRKPPAEGARKPKDLGDLYGDTFIGAHATSVISLWRKSKNDLEVIPLKIRLAAEVDSFIIHRRPNLSFSIGNVVSKTEEEEEPEEKEEKKTNGKSLFG